MVIAFGCFLHLPACLSACPCYSQLFWLISAPCLDFLLLGY